MGRQIYFYSAPEDNLVLLAALLDRPGCLVLQSLKSDKIRIDRSMLRDLASRPPLILLGRIEDMERGLFGDAVTPNMWRFDRFRSPVVELSLARIVANSLRAARLYFQSGRFNSSGDYVREDADFRKWANSLLSWIRAWTHELPGQDNMRVATHARRLYEEGKLELRLN